MTDSNGQRVPNGGSSSPIPGTEVTTAPGILPETFTVDTHSKTLDEIHTHLH